MHYLNSVTGWVVDAMVAPFDRPWAALVFVACVTAVLLLLVIRWTSSPEKVSRAKDRLLARVLELVLFRHDAVVSFGAGGRILAANFAYLGRLAWPLAISAVVCVLILVQLACWFANRPLAVGESALLEVRLREGLSADRRLTLSVPDAVRVETEALRIPALSEVDWRLRAVRAGDEAIDVTVEGEPAVRTRIVVGDGLRKVSLLRTNRSAWEAFLNPAEPPIDGTVSIVDVGVRYPRRQLYLGVHEIDWIVAFFVLTVLFGLVLKRPLGVRI